MRSGPYVEVQKTPGSTTWYNAVIIDIRTDTVRVEFEDEIWPPKDFPTAAVRRCPSSTSHAEEAFAPKVDDLLEVAIQATETNPSGWALGRLKKVKQKSFFFVSLEGSSKGPQDIIAEKDGIRPASREPTIADSVLVRKHIPVDKELHDWIRSQDSIGCLNDVQIRGKLLMASCTHTRPDAKGSPTVYLVGDERAVALGEKLLVEIHFKHQITMQRFHVHRDKLMEKLSQHESRKALHKEVFTVDSCFVGRIIGKKGENIKRIREKHEVQVLLQDPQGSDPWDVTTVTVSGADAESVRQAREEVEYLVVKIPIEADQVGWIVGKQYQNLHDIAQKAELYSARFDDESGSLELCGLRHQVEDAKMMISVHRNYMLVYQDMSEERRNIQQRFDELAAMDGGSGGKRGGKGGGGKKGPPPSALPAPSRGRGGASSLRADPFTSGGNQAGGKRGASGKGSKGRGK